MSKLPTSPRIAIGEQVFERVCSIIASYNGGQDAGICLRSWDANLKTLIETKLAKLGLAVVICAPERTPLQDKGGHHAALLTIKVIIESNPLLRPGDDAQVAGWDADDLGDLLAYGLDGWRGSHELPTMQVRVKKVESGRVSFTNKTVTLTLEKTAILKYV